MHRLVMLRLGECLQSSILNMQVRLLMLIIAALAALQQRLKPRLLLKHPLATLRRGDISHLLRDTYLIIDFCSFSSDAEPTVSSPGSFSAR
jgi:hypothetical protein